MATFYQGVRHVLKGRFGNNAIDPYTGKNGGNYAYYDLLNPSHVLDGFPDVEVQPDVFNERNRLYGNAPVLRGIVSPMKDPGDRNTESYIYEPWMWNGTPSSKLLSGDTGWNSWIPEFWTYKGIGDTVLAEVGNSEYLVDAWYPYDVNRIGAEPLNEANRNADYDSVWGYDDLHEWKGTPSSKAL